MGADATDSPRLVALWCRAPKRQTDLRARLLDAERQSTELVSEMERANEEAKRV